jgi:hypothetical protein
MIPDPAIAAELEALADSEARIAPERVVTWARLHPSSALHAAIPWDDQAAAHAHRLSVVRRLIQIHIVDVSLHRLTVSLVVDRHADGGYRPLGQVLSNSQFRAMAREEALRELERWVGRHSHFSEFEGLFSAVASYIRRLRGGEREAAD